MIYVQVRFKISPDGDYISVWIRCPTVNFSAAINSVEMLAEGYNLASRLRPIIMVVKRDAPSDGAEVYGFADLDKLIATLDYHRERLTKS